MWKLSMLYMDDLNRRSFLNCYYNGTTKLKVVGLLVEGCRALVIASRAVFPGERTLSSLNLFVESALEWRSSFDSAS